LQTGLGVSLSALLLSILVDSFFWNHWLYPEGEVFYFNTILQQSSRWGVSPWHHYFTVHLPKLLSGSSLLLVLSVLIDLVRNRRLVPYWIPLLVFVSLYSFLGHKEWRFIIYVIPMLNALAAVGVANTFAANQAAVTTGKSKKARNPLFRKFAFLVVAGILLASFVSSCFLFYISTWNYPGGVALERLHQLVPAKKRGK
jgi:alpha-1,6-mannosyltransferase